MPIAVALHLIGQLCDALEHVHAADDAKHRLAVGIFAGEQRGDSQQRPVVVADCQHAQPAGAQVFPPDALPGGTHEEIQRI